MSTQSDLSIPQGEKRPCIVFALIAKPRSGKTYNQVEYIKRINSKGRRVLVIDPDGSERAWRAKEFKRYNDISNVPRNFRGTVVVPYSKKEITGTPTFPYIQKMLDPRENGNRPGPWVGTVIVMDDANVYAKGQVEESIEWLFARKRQQGCDIILTGHSWMRIPPYFFDFIDVFCIGTTNGHPRARASFFEPDAMARTVEVRNFVNKYKDEHPDEYPFKLITIEGLPFKGVI